MKNLFFYSLTLFVITSCSKTTDYPDLVIEDVRCAIILAKQTDLPIISGSGDYSLDIQDKEICDATLSDDGSGIVFFGREIGATNVTVLDNKSQQKVQIAIKTVPLNAGLSLKILDSAVNISPGNDIITSDISKNSLFSIGNIIVLIPERNKVYVYNNEKKLNAGDYFAEGVYDFSFIDPKQIEFGIEDHIVTFDLDSQSCNHLRFYLTTPTSSGPVPHFVMLRNNLTDQYSSIYPNVDVASVTYQTLCCSSDVLKIPADCYFSNN